MQRLFTVLVLTLALSKIATAQDTAILVEIGSQGFNYRGINPPEFLVRSSGSRYSGNALNSELRLRFNNAAVTFSAGGSSVASGHFFQKYQSGASISNRMVFASGHQLNFQGTGTWNVASVFYAGGGATLDLVTRRHDYEVIDDTFAGPFGTLGLRCTFSRFVLDANIKGHLVHRNQTSHVPGAEFSHSASGMGTGYGLETTFVVLLTNELALQAHYRYSRLNLPAKTGVHNFSLPESARDEQFRRSAITAGFTLKP